MATSTHQRLTPPEGHPALTPCFSYFESESDGAVGAGGDDWSAVAGWACHAASSQPTIALVSVARSARARSYSGANSGTQPSHGSLVTIGCHPSRDPLRSLHVVH